MFKKIILLLIIINNINLIFGQDKKDELNQAKQYLPYIIKGIQENKTLEVNQKTVGTFDKPWTAKKIDKNVAKEILASIIKNKSFNIEKDYNEKWIIDFFSQIEPNNIITDAYNSNRILSNLFVELSEIEFNDKDNNSILETEKLTSQVNQSTALNFHTGVIQNKFHINKNYENITGSIKLNLKEFQKINFAEFNSNDINQIFKLDNQRGLKLLKIINNTAYIYLPNPIKNIRVSSTNKSDEEYAQNLKVIIPKTVYKYAIGTNVNENSTKKIIDELNIDDLEKSPQILIYQTNGTIDNLYIYLKSKPISLSSNTLQVKL